MIYSLANYKLSVYIEEPALRAAFGSSIIFGGNGSQLESISVNISGSIFDVQGYATGGYVFSKNYDRSGTISLNLNQTSEDVSKLKNLINMYYSGDYGPLTMVLTNNENEKVIDLVDCLPNGIPNQEFRSSAGTQSWGFDVGRITIY